MTGTKKMLVGNGFAAGRTVGGEGWLSAPKVMVVKEDPVVGNWTVPIFMMMPFKFRLTSVCLNPPKV